MENIEYLNEIQAVAGKLIHSYGVPVMITLFLRWLASIVAVFLMILDQTKWKYSNNIMASLLAPYLFSSLPIVIFQVLRNGVGKWIALLTVILRLFYQTIFMIPGATILLIVVTPSDIGAIFRDDLRYTGGDVCLLTSFYLINKHTKACGGIKNSFTQKDKVTYSICLWILFVYPILSSFAALFYL
ncbi:Cold-regulated 413 plasma membrane protein 3 [Arabidopsis thaliana]